MTMTIVTSPADEPVTLDELRQYLRLDGNAEDELLGRLLRAARETFEHHTGIAMMKQTWRLHTDCWPQHGVIRIARYPVASILSVTFYDEEGTPGSITEHALHLARERRPARVYLAARNRPQKRVRAVDVEFVAGFGGGSAGVPETMKHAVTALAAQWYEFRHGQGTGQGGATAQVFPPAFERALDAWRMVRL